MAHRHAVYLVILVLACVAAFLALGGAGALQSWEHWHQVAQYWSIQAPMATAASLIAFMAGLIVVLVPSTPIELAVAYVYGLQVGFVIVYAGKVIGCLCSYIVARLLWTRCRASLLARYRVLRALELAVEQQPWRMSFLVRAAYIPIAVKNYGLAALQVSPLTFAVSLLLIETYNTFEMVFIATSVHEMRDSLRSHEGAQRMGAWLSTLGTGLAAVCLIGLGCYGARVTRRALEQLDSDAHDDARKPVIISSS